MFPLQLLSDQKNLKPNLIKAFFPLFCLKLLLQIPVTFAILNRDNGLKCFRIICKDLGSRYTYSFFVVPMPNVIAVMICAHTFLVQWHVTDGIWHMTT